MVEDIAYLINRISNHNYFGLTTENPWILAGKSLGAVVPLLVRAKYPELTVGVYASSPLTPQPLAPEVSEKLY
jgi:surfactin synthase thioesterase subunit